MTVLLLERVSPGLRGELTRWLMEPKTGVFVGRISAMVRDKLWDLVCTQMKGGGGMLIHQTATEQGFSFRFHGMPSRQIVDLEGLSLVLIP